MKSLKQLLVLLFVAGIWLPCAVYGAENRLHLLDPNRRPASDVQAEKARPASQEPSTAPAQDGKPLSIPASKAAASQEKQELKSLVGLGGELKEEGEPLVIPEDAQNVAYLDGSWGFNHAFKSGDGQEMRMDFAFDKKGEGAVTLTGAREGVYTAKAVASEDGDALKIATGQFVNPATGNAFNPVFIECRNGSKGAECKGSDGFATWEGQRMFSETGPATAMAEKARESKTATSPTTAAQDSGKSGAQGAPAQAPPSRSSGAAETPETPLPLPPGAEPGKKYAELSPGGAEMSPEVMANSEKARAVNEGSDLAGLKGDWLYSQELSRQEDGRPLTLGFRFDQNGKGESYITDGSGKDFKAPAEAQRMKNGAIRVKTGSYENGSGQSFYPTFMECRGANNQDLSCDVSNGWMRINDGRLLSKNSYEEQTKKSGIEEILNMTPASQEAATAEARKSMEDILGGLPEESAAAQASAKGASTKPGATMQIPKQDDKSMEFLQGQWRCNTGLARAIDNQPVVVEFSFSKDGQGSAAIRERSGAVYTASAKATLRNGTLRINTSDFASRRARGGYMKCFIECRNQGSAAICTGENGGTVWRDATFTRLK